MYSIGEFLKLTNSSIKTLRYYDEIHLLVPSFVDKSTGYRYYDFDKFSEIQKINILKELGLSLDEIKQIKKGNFEQLHAFCLSQQEKLDKEKREIKKKQSLITDILLDSDGKIGNNYSVSNRQFATRNTITVLSVTDRIDLRKINNLVKRLFEKAYTYNIRLTGNLMGIIHRGTTLSDVEIMMEVAEKNIVEENKELLKIIAGGSYAFVYFKGLYADLSHAYDTLSKGNEKTNHFLEEYIDGLLPDNNPKCSPLAIRPNTEKHPDHFLTKVWMKR